MPGALDLFGNPLPDPRGPGRPPHVPTATTRRKVRRLRAKGEGQLAIADALGITVPTLTRHYARELDSNAKRHPPLRATKRNDNG